MKKCANKKCDRVKMLTKNHGNVWVCLKCKKCSKKVFTEKELDVMVDYIKVLRKIKS